MPPAFLEHGPRGIDLVRYPGGAVRHGYLERPAAFGGQRYQLEVAFWPDGRVRCGRLAEGAKIKGLVFRSFIWFHADGTLASGLLDEEATIGTLRFAAGQYVDFHPDGSVAAGRLAADTTAKGVALPADAFVRLDARGAATVVETRDLGGRWERRHDTWRYECSLDAAGFYCGGTDNNRFTEWGAARALREFLEGELAGFPREYMPDLVPEIVTLGRQVHAAFSDVPLYDFATLDGAPLPE